MNRPLAHAALLAVVLAASSLGPARALAGPCPGSTSSHPHFDDGGTLSWTTDLDAAQAAARSSGRLVLVEYGRRRCANCKTLVQCTLPCLNEKGRVAALFVGLAADCDEPDPRVVGVFDANLPNARLLPFVAFLTPDLRWITGWAGAATVAEVADHLAKAEEFRTRAKPLAARPEPAAAPRAATLSPGAAAPPAMPPAAPPAAEVERAKALLASARQAAAAGTWCEVRRLAAEARRLPVTVEPAQWAALGADADRWCEERLGAALCAAKERRVEDASAILAAVSRGAAAGTGLREEVLRGEKAIARWREVEAAKEGERASARAAALEEFRGTRWQTLFQG